MHLLCTFLPRHRNRLHSRRLNARGRSRPVYFCSNPRQRRKVDGAAPSPFFQKLNEWGRSRPIHFFQDLHELRKVDGAAPSPCVQFWKWVLRPRTMYFMTVTGVPLLDLAAQNGPLMDELRAAFERVAKSNAFILGGEVTGFEQDIAAFLGVKHAIGVSSGTDALLVALMALGIEPGDEVLTTPFSFFATAGCVARLNAKPVFVDIDPVSFNLKPDALEAAATARTKAVLPVHLFGQPCDMKGVMAFANARGLPVIEDAAQAIGAKTSLGPVGGVGQFGCFSFFPSKNLGAFGDGGLVTTNNDATAEKLRLLRGHGAKPKYFHAMVGGNFRIDALQAAILKVKLPHLAGWTETRRTNAARYDKLFAEAGLPEERLITPKQTGDDHIYNQYSIRTPFRDALVKHLSELKIGNEIYYPLCLHLQKCFADLGYNEGSMPNAERASKEVLALPIFPELGEDRLTHVANVVIDFIKKQ